MSNSASATADTILRHGDIVLNLETLEVTRAGLPIHLQALTFRMLAVAILRRNTFFSRGQLYQAGKELLIRGKQRSKPNAKVKNVFDSEKTQMSKLRACLGEPDPFQTLPGMRGRSHGYGYRLRPTPDMVPEPEEPGQILQHGNLTVNLTTMEVRRGEKPVNISPGREFDILAALMNEQGAVLTKEVLHTTGRSQRGSELADLQLPTRRRLKNGVAIQISHIQKKLGEPKIIETVRGIGYKIPLADGP